MSLRISPRTSGGFRFPAATPSNAPPAIGAAPKASSAIPMVVSLPSLHKCRGERAGGLAQRERSGHLVYRIGRADGVVIDARGVVSAHQLSRDRRTELRARFEVCLARLA